MRQTSRLRESVGHGEALSGVVTVSENIGTQEKLQAIGARDAAWISESLSQWAGERGGESGSDKAKRSVFDTPRQALAQLSRRLLKVPFRPDVIGQPV